MYHTLYLIRSSAGYNEKYGTYRSKRKAILHLQAYIDMLHAEGADEVYLFALTDHQRINSFPYSTAWGTFDLGTKEIKYLGDCSLVTPQPNPFHDIAAAVTFWNPKWITAQQPQKELALEPSTKKESK